MGNKFRLFLVVAVGSLMATVLYFGLALALAALLQRPSVPRIAQGLGLAITVLVPIFLAAWWIFRRLQVQYARREARAAAIAFGISTPVPLILGLVLGQIVGGYTGLLFGNRFAFPGAVAGIVLMIALMTFVPSVLALWVTRRIGRANQPQ